MCGARPLLVLCSVLASLTSGAGKVCTGSASSTDGFAFACKFCFDYGTPPPKMTVNAVLDLQGSGKAYADMRVLMYDDQAESWTAVYGHPHTSCVKRFQWPKQHLTSYNLTSAGTSGIYSAKSTISEHLRPRTWFVVIADRNCRPFKDVKYTLTMLNGDSAWSRQFGIDERGLNTFYLCSTIMYALLFVYQRKSEAKYSEGAHLLRLLTVSIALCMLSAVLMSLNYILYTFNGHGFALFKIIGDGVAIAGGLVLILVLLLFAQGWTIFNAAVQRRSLVIFCVGALFAAEAMLHLWAGSTVSATSAAGGVHVGHDAASTQTTWDTAPGALLIAIDVLVFFFAAYLTWNTLQQQNMTLAASSENSENSTSAPKTFKLVAATGLLWMLVRPVSILICANVLNPWVRTKWLVFIVVMSTLAAQCALSYILWPTRGGVDVQGQGQLAAGLLADDARHANAPTKAGIGANVGPRVSDSAEDWSAGL